MMSESFDCHRTRQGWFRVSQGAAGAIAISVLLAVGVARPVGAADEFDGLWEGRLTGCKIDHPIKLQISHGSFSTTFLKRGREGQLMGRISRDGRVKITASTPGSRKGAAGMRGRVEAGLLTAKGEGRQSMSCEMVLKLERRAVD